MDTKNDDPTGGEMKEHRAIGTFVDIETGKQHEPGEKFTPTSEAQRVRLVDGGCIARPITEEEEA